MIYNEMYENLGECEYALYLGCRECTKCAVEEYQNEVKREIEKQQKKEQIYLENKYGGKYENHEKDEKCVYNKSSELYKEVLEFHEKEKDWEYYPGIESIQMDTCYKCNRCKIWG